MSAKKTVPSASPAKRALLGKWPSRLGSRGVQLLLVGMLAAAIAGGGYTVWQRVRTTLLAGEDYRLEPNEVEITPPPPWIHADVRGEAVRNASLDGGPSILDDDLAERIAKAFALHPWVAQVKHVRKRHPAGVEVELVYRRPVCMVELPGGGLFPVDADAVLLPTADFTPLEAQGYPRLVEIHSLPVGPVGARWGDPRVAGGAAIAAALSETWNDLGLARIVPSKAPISRQAADDYTYELFTPGGTRIVWGRAPNAQTPGEAPPVEKVARLKKHFLEHGALDGPDGPREFDLRQTDAADSAWTAGREEREKGR
jgi:hypothetical protein